MITPERRALIYDTPVGSHNPRAFKRKDSHKIYSTLTKKYLEEDLRLIKALLICPYLDIPPLKKKFFSSYFLSFSKFLI
jgi:hypothetical protein